MKLFFIFSVIIICFCSVVIVKQIAIEQSSARMQSQVNKIDLMVSKVYAQDNAMVIDKYYIESKVKRKKLSRLEELFENKVD